MSGLPTPSASDSEKESEPMFIPLAEIKTIRQLYAAKILKQVAKPRYPLNAALLDKISLL
jgi:hypothetical protein